jgi:hypothetical protein
MSEKTIEELDAIRLDEKAPVRDRLAACCEILDRQFGPPTLAEEAQVKAIVDAVMDGRLSARDALTEEGRDDDTLN